MSYNLATRDWRELSEAASKERDPKKLMDLVTELNEALKQREDRLHQRPQSDLPTPEYS
ncbi:MAG TPA: hypothetical protein VEV41_27835 [Terriglobales bacterium]|jgi:hypothetical protein|nr:hypothetical protein [Terriglobales bacterium]